MNTPHPENEVPILSVLVDQVFEFVNPAIIHGAPPMGGIDAGPTDVLVSVIVDQVFEFTDKLVDGSPTLNGTTAGQGASTPESAA